MFGDASVNCGVLQGDKLDQLTSVNREMGRGKQRANMDYKDPLLSDLRLLKFS